MSIEDEIRKGTEAYFKSLSREQFKNDLEKAGFKVIDGDGKIIFTEPGENDYVYCAYCKWFRLDDENIPYCPYELECDIWNCEDSRPFRKRPKYEYQK